LGFQYFFSFYHVNKFLTVQNNKPLAKMQE
jgi:hypothetical protein